LQAIGGSAAGATPFCSGPRHCGQFWSGAVAASARAWMLKKAARLSRAKHKFCLIDCFILFLDVVRTDKGFSETRFVVAAEATRLSPNLYFRSKALVPSAPKNFRPLVRAPVSATKKTAVARTSRRAQQIDRPLAVAFLPVATKSPPRDWLCFPAPTRARR